MCISSSSTFINSCCYVLMVLFITTTYAYVIDTDDLRNNLNDQHLGANIPLYYDRLIRTTKFPRIGRSPSDIEEISSLYDTNTNTEEIEDNNNENESRWVEQRSVLFPRIGRRAFHGLPLGNSFFNPYHMFDTQGQNHLNGYDYHIHKNQPQSAAHYRGKRSISM